MGLCVCFGGSDITSEPLLHLENTFIISTPKVDLLQCSGPFQSVDRLNKISCLDHRGSAEGKSAS